MSDDIVKLLRHTGGDCYEKKVMIDAACEIERLRQLSGDAGQLRSDRDPSRLLEEFERNALWNHLVQSTIEWLKTNHVAGSQGPASIYAELRMAIDRWQDEMLANVRHRNDALASVAQRLARKVKDSHE